VIKADVTDSTHVQNRCYKALQFLLCNQIFNMFRIQKSDTGPHSFENEFPSLYWFGELYPKRKHNCVAMSGLTSLLSTITILFTEMRM
jgi:hypothetical protein